MHENMKNGCLMFGGFEEPQYNILKFFKKIFIGNVWVEYWEKLEYGWLLWCIIFLDNPNVSLYGSQWHQYNEFPVVLGG